MADFSLHPAFPASSHAVGELELCHVRLHDDARYPWLVLIPRADGLVEIEDLSAEGRAALTEEVVAIGAAVRAVARVLGVAIDKLNVGALGNVTPQLHVHVLGRRAGDPAWPGPVWGHSAGVPYPEDLRATAIAAARAALGL